MFKATGYSGRTKLRKLLLETVRSANLSNVYFAFYAVLSVYLSLVIGFTSTCLASD